MAATGDGPTFIQGSPTQVDAPARFAFPARFTPGFLPTTPVGLQPTGLSSPTGTNDNDGSTPNLPVIIPSAVVPIFCLLMAAIYRSIRIARHARARHREQSGMSQTNTDSIPPTPLLPPVPPPLSQRPWQPQPILQPIQAHQVPNSGNIAVPLFHPSPKHAFAQVRPVQPHDFEARSFSLSPPSLVQFHPREAYGGVVSPAMTATTATTLVGEDPGDELPKERRGAR
jgi:hypothetical protein